MKGDFTSEFNKLNRQRIVSVGDLHGDYKATVKILMTCKVIPKNSSIYPSKYETIKWIGGSTYLVQLGDILDGKSRSYNNSFIDNEFHIFLLLLSLKKQAQRKKGNILFIFGNHELMNMVGDYRYVSNTSLKTNGGITKRNHFFKTGSLFCKNMSEHYYGMVKIRNMVFVHGNIHKTIANTYTLDKINTILKKFLLDKLTSTEYRDFKTIYDNSNIGICWSREYSADKLSSSKCAELQQILKKFKASHIIVGHTVQENGINLECENKQIIKVDVGLSGAFDSINKQALEIIFKGPKYTLNILK